MRLLVLDESWQVTGGVDTIRRFLVPALAARTEKLVWACSEQACLNRLENLELPKVEIVDLHPPSKSARGLVWAALRRLPLERTPKLQARVQTFLSHGHLRQVCRREGLTHVLELCVHRQRFPQLNRPITGIVHDLNYPNRGASPLDHLFRDWLKHADQLIADSSLTCSHLAELDPRAAAQLEVVLLPSKPRPDLPNTAEINPWKRPEPVFFYPARATPHKGHHVLLAALAKLAAKNIPFHCYLSGYGTEWLFRDEVAPELSTEDSRKLCLPYREALHGRVTIVGTQPWANIEQLYRAANVVVFPSSFEGFGLPLSEALSWERPVVAARLWPLEEQVAFLEAGEQVRWFPPGDESALATVLQEVLSGHAPFPPYSTALRERLAAWNWAAYARRVLDILEKTPIAR